MQIKKGSNEFNSYIISPGIKVYDAYIALMSNREKTLIVADNKKVYGSVTTGDFKRKISFTLGKDILKASDLEVSQIKTFSANLISYLGSSKPEYGSSIASSGKFDDAAEATLKAAVETVKAGL